MIKKSLSHFSRFIHLAFFVLCLHTSSYAQSCENLYSKVLELLSEGKNEEAFLYSENNCRACDSLKQINTNPYPTMGDVAADIVYAKALYINQHLKVLLHKDINMDQTQLLIRMLNLRPDFSIELLQRIAFDLNEAIKKTKGLPGNKMKSQTEFHQYYNIYDLVASTALSPIFEGRFDWMNDSISRGKFIDDSTNLLLFYCNYLKISIDNHHFYKALSIYKKIKNLNYRIRNELVTEVTRLNEKNTINEIIEVKIDLSLVDCYIQIDSLEKAMQQIANWQKRAGELGVRNESDLECKLKLGHIYFSQGNYTKAFTEFSSCVDWLDSHHGSQGDPLLLANIYDYYARTCIELNKLEEPEKSLDKAMEQTVLIKEKYINEMKKIDLGFTRCFYYYKSGNIGKILPVLQKLTETVVDKWDANVMKFSFVNHDFLQRFYTLKKLLFNLPEAEHLQSTAELCFNVENCIEQITLSDYILPKNGMPDYPNVINARDSLFEKVNKTLMGSSNENILVDQENLEAALNGMQLIAQPYKLGGQKIDFYSITPSLLKKQAMIKFVNFPLFSKDKWNDDQYGCFVFVNGENPTFLSLFNGTALKAAMNDRHYLYGNDNIESEGQKKTGNKHLYQLLLLCAGSILLFIISFFLFTRFFKTKRTKAILIASIVALAIAIPFGWNMLQPTKKGNPANALYDTVWSKIASYLAKKDIKQLIILPAGELNRISFAELFASAKSEFANCDLVFNTSLQYSDTTKKENYIDAAIFGGINYDTTSYSFQGENKITTPSMLFIKRPGDEAKSWAGLPKTNEEKKELSNICSKNKINVSIYDSLVATEENFKALSGHSPSILHLATHGFYSVFEKNHNEEENKIQGLYLPSIKDPMYRSGLVLAGGNLKWVYNINAGLKEDGIVTSAEIAQLDFTKTKLVVLSACESGLGDINGGEGVYGLLRAFKIAGAKNIIVSLWSVLESDATGQFMTSFYERLLNKKMEVAEAFNETQKDFKSRYPEDPRKWAMFQLYQ